MSRRWTPSEVSDLEVMYPDRSIPSEDLEAHFGRSWNAIFVQANRHGLRRRYPDGKRSWTDEEKAELARLYATSESLEAVAATLQRSVSSVATMAHYLKLRMRDR